MSHTINPRAAPDSLDTVFDPAHALPDIVEDWEHLVGSRAAVAANCTEGGKQLASGNDIIGGLGPRERERVRCWVGRRQFYRTVSIQNKAFAEIDTSRIRLGKASAKALTCAEGNDVMMALSSTENPQPSLQ